MDTSTLSTPAAAQVLGDGEMTVQQFRDTAAALEAEVGKVIVGQAEVVRHVLICIVAGGHALLEGVPGLGKTMLIKTLADALDLQFARILGDRRACR